MIQLDVAFIPTELDQKSPEGTLAVVIDVVRASTTIVTALAHGCRAISPVLTVKQAFAMQQSTTETRSPLLGGERGGVRVEGFDLGNSPREYTRDRVQNRSLIFSTSNGTRTLLALDGASAILLSAFVNMSAVCDALVQVCQPRFQQETRILIACSGVVNTFSLEDAVCAGMMVSVLDSRFPEMSKSPSASAAEILYHHYAADLVDMLMTSDGGRRLIPLGLEADLAVCADVDRYHIVPMFKDGTIVIKYDYPTPVPSWEGDRGGQKMV